MDVTTRLAALRAERQAVLDYCAQLDADEWLQPSRAEGWRVRDVVAHLAATVRTLFSPAGMVAGMRSADVERLNDQLVAKRAEWPKERVLGEFRRFSGLSARALAAARGPVGAIRLPVGELGRYPLRLTPSMVVFDWHVHLRHDIAPALDRPVPPTDAGRLAVVLEWMLAGMEQMQRGSMGFVDRPLALKLTGLAGGSWRIELAGGGLLRVRPGSLDGTAAQISGDSQQFPSWATTRTRWRDADVQIAGDEDYATKFLDTLNIV